MLLFYDIRSKETEIGGRIMVLFQRIFKQKHDDKEFRQNQKHPKVVTKKNKWAVAEAQLDRLPNDFKIFRSVMMNNPDKGSRHSKLDYVILSPYGIFTIKMNETKGVVKAEENQKTWTIDKHTEIPNPFIEINQHIEGLQHLLDSPSYQDYFISIVSFQEKSTFDIAPGFRKIASNELIVTEEELLEFIHRKIFVARFQFSVPLLNEESLDYIYHSLKSYQNVKGSKIKEKY